jgi:hypothetical protein
MQPIAYVPEVSDHAEVRLPILAKGFNNAIVTVAVGLIGLDV